MELTRSDFTRSEHRKGTGPAMTAYNVEELDPGTQPVRDEDTGRWIVRPATCGACGRTWDFAKFPTPATRCPWEHEHEDEDTETKLTTEALFALLRDNPRDCDGEDSARTLADHGMVYIDNVGMIYTDGTIEPT